MRAGALDRRVTLRHATISKDEYNADVETWSDIATVWASKADISDAERVRAQQTGASITTRFQIRYSTAVAALTTRDQLECDGRLYQVANIKELGRRSGLEITATAKL
jgi:SPP1 family predicted phage head-tail adaptor